jgi:DNA invertase Pin-like site-specific DNA recombinase
MPREWPKSSSGKDTKRPQLELLMSFVRSGDTVIIHSMDRLARNLDDLRRIVQTLTARGVQIEFVKEHLASGGYPFNAGQPEYDHRYSKCPEGLFLATLTSGV